MSTRTPGPDSESDPFAEDDLPMVRPGTLTAIPEPAAEDPAESGAEADPGPESVPPPDPVDPAPATDEDDEDEDDASDGEAWRTWLGDDQAPAPAPVQLTGRGVWDLPDYDAPEDPAGAGLIDRSGRAGGSLRRRRNPGIGDSDTRARRGGLALSLCVGVGVAVLAVAIIVNVGLGGPDRHTATRHTTTAPVPLAPATTNTAPAPADIDAADVATPDCQQTPPTATSGSGTGTGDTTSGPGVILAFERAYYVARSGPASAALLDPTAQVPSAAALQDGIDRLPTGTRYCVQIAPAGAVPGAWAVTLTEQWPGDQIDHYAQTITTRAAEGRTLITGITA